MNILDVAKEAQVSAMTVSRVVGGREDVYVRAETRARVLRAVEKLGYTMNRAAKSLSSGKSGLVMVWIYRPYLPQFGSILFHLQRESQRRGYGLLVVDPELFAGNQSAPVAPKGLVDGVFAVDCAPHLEKIIAANGGGAAIPVVHLGSNIVEGVDSVRIDYLDAMAKLLDHLVAAGCRRILHLNRLRDVHDQIGKVYRKKIRQAGLSEHFVHCAELDCAVGLEMVLAWVDQHGVPDAVTCRNDLLAMGAQRALLDRDVPVPEQVLVAGADGLMEGEYLHARLTTIKACKEELCQKAWDLMEDRLNHPVQPYRKMTVKAELVLRQSTQFPHATDAEAQGARAHRVQTHKAGLKNHARQHKKSKITNL